MAQVTHQTNGPGLPPYPQEVELLTVEVWVHDSGMIATHNYPCPVCRERSAVLELSRGLMNCCWDCQADGWEVRKKEPVCGPIAWFVSLFK